MGNQLAAAQTSGSYQDQQVLQQRIGEFSMVEQLGGGRFLKSFMCLHDEGQLVMKIYTKRETVSLQRMARELEAMRDKFNRNWPECCNVAAFTRVVETEHYAYLLRQHVHHNLYERMSQRPFLHLIERKWIAYQLLQALVQSHSCGVCHGDIKTENVVLTAWDWVLLADFAPFKPRSLPDDNPADFSFFFDTPGRQGRPGRRLCYVAPERFTSGDGEALPAPVVTPRALVTPRAAPEVERSAPLPVRMPSESGFTVPGADDDFGPAPTASSSSVRSMGEEWRPSGGELATAHDVFSLGCVIAELFGKTVTPTFSYAEMLRYRKERAAFPLEAKLQEIAEPEVREMVRSMLSLDPSMRLSAADYLESRTPSIFPAYFSEFLHQFMAKLLRTSHDEKISIVSAAQDELISKLAGMESEPSESGLIVIVNVVTSSLPHLTTPWIKVEALRLLGKFAAHVDDDTRLQRLLPHILSVASDESTVVRAACITAATAVLEPVVEVPAMDIFLFPEYILPAFHNFPDDENTGVRIAHANCIGSLANAAHTFHRARWDLIAQKNAEHAAEDHGDAESEEDEDEENEHEEMEKMRDDFKRNILSVLIDTNPAVRRAGLHGILRLGTFFGEKLADELLPHIIANLNEKDWELRSAFFDSITNVAICVGQTAVTEFILPCIVQALTDYEKFVIEKALHALAVLYELELLDANVMLDVLEKQVTVMVCHPTLPVRAAAVACVLACASQLSMAEVHCKLLPILRPYLKTADIVVVNEESLLELLRPPLSKGEWDRIVHSTPQNAEATMRIFDTCAEWVDQKYAPSAVDEVKAKADEVVGNAFRTYDPSGLVELEDREKLVLMRNYIRDFHAKTQTTIALWESENMERMQAGAGNMGGEMTPYFTLSQRIPAFRKPIGGPEGSEGLDYPAVRGAEVAEGSTHPVTTAKAAAAAAATAAGAAAVAAPGTPMRSAAVTFGGLMPPPPTPGAQAASSGEPESVSVAAWPTEKLRMYAVPPAALTTASSSASLVVNGTQVHTAGDYGGPSTPLGRAAEGGDEIEDRPSGLLPAHLDTWRPHGALCAHIHEHKAAVNAFSVSPDGSYFVSASDDGTVKMWRNSALAAHVDEVGMDLQDEPSLTQAWYTYSQQSGRILDVCTYGGGGAIATASDAGSIHCVAMVDGGVVRIRRIAPEEGAITKLATVPQSPDLLIYATEGGSLHCADKRAPTDAWVCENLAPYGLTTGIVVGSGSEWLAASSSRGFVSIWDTRFHLKVDTWRHPSCSPIYAMTGANPPPIHGRRGARGSSAPCVALATAGAEVSVWDLCGKDLRASLRVGAANDSVDTKVIRPPSQRAGGGMYGVDTFASDDELGLRAGGSRGARSTEHVCGMTSASNGGYMLTAGTDSKIRLWDMVTPGACCVVGNPHSRPNVSDGFSVDERGLRCLSWSDVEDVPAGAQPGGGAAAGTAMAPTKCHQDAITSLAVVSAAGAEPLVLSGGRDGVIKLWH